MSAKSVFTQVSPSIVVIRPRDESYKSLGQGSGVVVGDGIVVTNWHVVKNATTIFIEQAKDTQGAGTYKIKADIIIKHEGNDLCLLFALQLTKPPAAKIAKLGSAKSLVIGEEVYAVGAPKDQTLSLSRGIVAQLRNSGDSEKNPEIQTDAAISPGSSGGGLFNEDNELVGITTYKLVGGENLNFAKPAEMVSDLIQLAHYKTKIRKLQAALWQECTLTPNHKYVLTLAHQSALQIDDRHDRAIALNYIASSQAKAGYSKNAERVFNSALLAAQQIVDDYHRTLALRDIAIAQAQTGDSKYIKITANQIYSNPRRIEVLGKIAILQAQADSSDEAKITFDNALHSAKQIHDPDECTEALRYIANTQAEAGYSDDARKTFDASINKAEGIRDISDRTVALRKIACAQAQAKFSDAKTIFDRALSSAWRINNHLARAMELKDIAQAQAKYSDNAKKTFDSALESAWQINDSRVRAMVLNNIAQAQAQAHDFNAAEITVQRIDYDLFRAEALGNIASAQAQYGDLDGAKKTFENALRLTQRIDYHVLSRTPALKDIATAQAEAGDFNSAKMTAQEIDYALFHAEALRNIAILQADAGDITEAMQTARLINDESEKALALYGIAEAMTEQQHSVPVTDTDNS